MAKFKFGLRSLQKVRSHRLMMAKKEAMVAELELDDLKRQILTAESSRRECLEGIEISLSDATNVKVLSFLVESETDRMKLLGEKMVPKQVEVERHRSWVAELAKELKALERLEEKQRKAFEDEMKVQERRRVDRWGSEQYALAMSRKESEGVPEQS